MLRRLNARLVVCLVLGAGCQTPGGPRSAALCWQIPFQGTESAPVLANGLLYVGSRDGALYAFDPETGAERWRFETGAGLGSGTEIAAEGEPRATPFTWARREIHDTPVTIGDSVFVGSYDLSFYALDARTGAERWSIDTHGRSGGARLLGPDLLAFSSANPDTRWDATSDANALRVVDASSGRSRWTFTNGHQLYGWVMMDDVIYVASRQGQAPLSTVHALDPPTGAVHWRIDVDGYVLSQLVATRGRLLVVTFPRMGAIGQGNTLYAIDPALRRIAWQFRVPDFVYSVREVGRTVLLATLNVLFVLDSDTGAQRWSAPATPANVETDGRLAFVTRHERGLLSLRSVLEALDLETGALRWSVTLAPPGVGGVFVQDLHVHEGTLQAAANYGRPGRDTAFLHAFEAATGAPLWSFETPTTAVARPLFSEGRIFLATREEEIWGSEPLPGYLSALAPDAASCAPPGP